MKRLRPRRQRGIALMAFMLVVTIGVSALFLKHLNDESGLTAAVRKNRNAEVLNRAKRALIGYVARRAATSGENNPGRLPCPEAVNNIGTSSEGISAPWIGPPTTTTCNSIGRLPWRTLGLDKLVDTSGEPLWYVVGPSWRLTTSTTTLVINSNTLGDIAVDGQQVVAVIIAPGAAMNVQTSAGCVARNQTRSAPSPTMDARDYLECFDFATSSLFVTTAPSTSFNDQVLVITVADVMPAIEAAIALRIEREIVPELMNAYLAPNWGLSGTDRIYPFAAPFSNPGTSSFTGSPAAPQGWLPLVYSELSPPTAAWPYTSTLCTVSVTAPRCDPSIAGWTNWASSSPSMSYTGAGVTLTSACSYWGQRDYAFCSGTYLGTPTTLTISGTQAGTTALRALNTISPAPTGFAFWFDLTLFSFTWSQPTPTLQIQSDGSLAVQISIIPPVPAGPAGVMYWLYVPAQATMDHPLLDASTASATGWFLRNEWHKLTYYAAAPGYTAAAAAPRACATGTSCLSIANVSPAGAQRAILILAGRSINGSARPSAALGDYLEFGNATAAYERRAVGANTLVPAQRFNDRIVVMGSN